MYNLKQTNPIAQVRQNWSHCLIALTPAVRPILIHLKRVSPSEETLMDQLIFIDSDTLRVRVLELIDPNPALARNGTFMGGIENAGTEGCNRFVEIPF